MRGGLRGPRDGVSSQELAQECLLKYDAGMNVQWRKETMERIPTTGGIRFVEVPNVPTLECAVSTLSEKTA